MGKGKCKFKDKWLHDTRCKKWLRKGSSLYYAHCIACKGDLCVKNGVEDAQITKKPRVLIHPRLKSWTL